MLEGLEQRWVPSTVTVKTNLDSGTGSLRAAIASAHNGDTIVFDKSLNGSTITLTSGELLINHVITIAGPGATNLTISGNNASRVFEVASTVPKNVTLSGLTVSNGVAFLGGGILNSGVLTVSNCTLSGNVTTTRGGGGGIHNDGTLTVSGTMLTSNSAPGGGSGGGIYNSGPLTISASTLSSNSAGTGGGIYNTGGIITINPGSTLSGNSANAGGGIYNQAGTIGALTVSGSALSGNSANIGGGIYNYDGALTVSGSTLSGNSASEEGVASTSPTGPAPTPAP
jgi:hypothetical protein